MSSLALLAAVAAVLLPQQVVLIDTSGNGVVATMTLSGPGAAIFATPDGRVLVPLADTDGTVLIDRTGRLDHWPGRVFPLFFDEWDRMHVLMPGVLATLSYPERLELRQAPLPGVEGIQRAACSADGRLIALIPSDEPASLLMLSAHEPAGAIRVALPAAAHAVAVAPDGTFVVAALADASVVLAAPGAGGLAGRVALGGAVRGLAVSADGGWVFAGIDQGNNGAVVGLKVRPGANEPLRSRFTTPLPAPVRALAVAGAAVLVLLPDRLVVLGGGRRPRGETPIAGGLALATLPARGARGPAWSD